MILAGLVGTFELERELDRTNKDLEINYLLTTTIRGGIYAKLTGLLWRDGCNGVQASLLHGSVRYSTV
jgi:hypothetical protein